jgi:aspartate/methionine/tyrosine aminotransferase
MRNETCQEHSLLIAHHSGTLYNSAMLKLSNRMSRLGTETAFDVLVRAKQLEAKGKDVIHLEIGEPDFDTPENIVDAAVHALHHGAHHYGPSAGLPEMRKAIAEETARTRGIPVDPSEVVVTPGAKPVIFFTILALVDPEDEVLYPNPGFPIYESMIEYVGAKAVPVPLKEEKNWSLDIDELEKKVNPKVKLLILNSPHNPTGGVIPESDLRRIADLAVKNDFMVLSDEIYRRILYTSEYHSISSYPGMKERTIILDGFSKIFAMTGWRLGYGIMRSDLAQQVSKLQTNATSCTATFTQLAGVEALQGDQSKPEAMVRTFRERRDFIVNGLNDIPGFNCRTPDGAFYAFPNVRKIGVPSKKLADLILEEGGVACLSGTAFGANGEGYLRFSYANSKEKIGEALSRVRKTLMDHKLIPF